MFAASDLTSRYNFRTAGAAIWNNFRQCRPGGAGARAAYDGRGVDSLFFTL